MENIIYFHARRTKNSEHRTHTLAFTEREGSLIMAFAVPNKSFDHFSKRIGREITNNRILKAQNKKISNSYMLNTPLSVNRDSLNTMQLPREVVKTIDHYVGKAQRYFENKGKTIKNLIIIRPKLKNKDSVSMRAISVDLKNW